MPRCRRRRRPEAALQARGLPPCFWPHRPSAGAPPRLRGPKPPPPPATPHSAVQLLSSCPPLLCCRLLTRLWKAPRAAGGRGKPGWRERHPAASRPLPSPAAGARADTCGLWVGCCGARCQRMGHDVRAQRLRCLQLPCACRQRAAWSTGTLGSRACPACTLMHKLSGSPACTLTRKPSGNQACPLTRQAIRQLSVPTP